MNPIFDSNSKILILGSFPSVRSREEMFYYAHPQNRFWKLISALLNSKIPMTKDEKVDLLLNNNIALWDVIKSCDIIGSADSTITNVIPNNIRFIIDKSKIELIVFNGRTSEKYFKRFQNNSINVSSICLPSTSPANAAFSFDKLLNEWNVILDVLK